MKKILLATTLMVATAGMAAAEVKTSGSARMGLVNNSVDTFFSSRVRISFDATGETDSGLSFGASVRADQSGQGNQANNDSTVFVSGAFGKLTFGDTGNAVDSILGQVSGVGYTGNTDKNEIAFLPRVVTGAQYEYTAGSVTFALGLGQNLDAAVVAPAPDAAGEEFYSVAAKYATDAFSVGLGYENVGDDSTAVGDTPNSQITLTGSTTVSGATLKLKVVDRETAADLASAVSVDYTTGATTITAFATNNVDFADTNTFGLGASYDLGGGAKFLGGISSDTNDSVYDLGLTFSF